MTGFLGMIEGFIAFALTMVALATVVSVVVGLWIGFLRRRRIGFLEMLDTFVRNHLVPLYGEKDQKLTTEQASELRAKALVVFGLSPKAVGSASQTDENLKNDPRLKPAREIVEVLSARKLGFWAMLFQGMRAIALGGLAQSINLFRKDLSAEEFEQKLDGWFEIDERLSTTAKRQLESGALVKRLRREYEAQASGARERFTDFARGSSIVAAFLLAGLLNIDAFSLLQRYLYDSSARESVLQDQVEILTAGRTGDLSNLTFDSAASASIRAREQQAQDALREAEAVVQKLKAEAEKIPDGGALKALAPDLDAAIKSAKDKVGTFSDSAQAAAKNGQVLLSDAAEALEGSANAVAFAERTFFVGWDLFPGCLWFGDPAQDAQADPRCAKAGRGIAPSFGE